MGQAAEKVMHGMSKVYDDIIDNHGEVAKAMEREI